MMGSSLKFGVQRLFWMRRMEAGSTGWPDFSRRAFGKKRREHFFGEAPASSANGMLCMGGISGNYPFAVHPGIRPFILPIFQLSKDLTIRPDVN
ncbi:MAG: hypothetical protein HYZ46_03340 [Nitrosomonadales bacterium]|nr:hypothetical protein [Nitrosomonadales bacterium]